MNRHVYSSRETNFIANESMAKKVVVYSMFPIDRASCPCAKEIMQLRKRLAMATPKDREGIIKELGGKLVCPRDKTGMTRFVITCANCKEVQGYLWATDATLKDWCDFHYSQWSDGERWRGCFTPHISPITEQLCLECCCGQDTRDFRANMTLPDKVALRREAVNAKGRAFNQTNSKFLVRKFSGNVLL